MRMTEKSVLLSKTMIANVLTLVAMVVAGMADMEWAKDPEVLKYIVFVQAIINAALRMMTTTTVVFKTPGSLLLALVAGLGCAVTALASEAAPVDQPYAELADASFPVISAAGHWEMKCSGDSCKKTWVPAQKDEMASSRGRAFYRWGDRARFRRANRGR